MEALGDRKEFAAADCLVDIDLELDPTWLTPDEGEQVVAGIMQQGGGVAVHAGEGLAGRIDVLGGGAARARTGRGFR